MEIKALTFDTGGTILDWHGGISRALAAAGARHGLAADWAAVTNDYRRRSLQEITGQVRPAFNFDDVHRRAAGLQPLAAGAADAAAPARDDRCLACEAGNDSRICHVVQPPQRPVVSPPSTTRRVPVTHFASSEAR